MFDEINQNSSEGFNDIPVNAQETNVNSSQPNTDLFEYVANGRTIKEDRDTVLKRASMGYNYAQQMEQFNKQKSDFERTIQEQQARISQMESKWKPYEDYASQNPDWEQHVRQSWLEKINNGGMNTPNTGIQQQPLNIPQELQQKLSKVDQILTHYERQEQDQMLHREIESLKQKHPTVDFVSTDPNTGKSLEYAVLEHARNMGITNFRAAFYDFYHDKLVKQAEENAKQALVTQKQDAFRQGFIGTSQQPQTMQNMERPKQNLARTSWDEIIKMAGRDLASRGIN